MVRKAFCEPVASLGWADRPGDTIPPGEGDTRMKLIFAAEFIENTG